MRTEHMKSTFLLGILFYDKVKIIRNSIDKKSIGMFRHAQNQHKKYISSHEGELCGRTSTTYDSCKELDTDQLRQEFLYMWYLICLFHDFGYLHEDKGEKLDTNDIPIKDEIVSGSYFVSHPIFGIPEKLRKNAILYFQLRLQCPRFNPYNLCIDHGVAGGVRMYNLLEKIHSGEYICSDIPNTLLHGRPIFESNIVPAAWTIICHNIWTCLKGSKDELRYTSLGLSDLVIGKGHPLIKLQEHPFLFLLCLIDTIEPIKKLYSDPPHVKEILEAISIRFEQESTLSRVIFQTTNRVSYPCTLTCKCCGIFEKMKNDLDDFLVSPFFKVKSDYTSLEMTFSDE